jgi:hypothetical protein
METPIDDVLKEKIIKFCIDNPKEKKLIADAYNITRRRINKWLKILKQKKATEIMKKNYPNYFN